MNQRGVVQREDGGVDIVIPVPWCFLTFDQIIAKDAPTARKTTVAKIPQSRLFRQAWTDEYETETVDVHIPRAQVIAHEHRRVKRSELFAPLDVEATIPAKAQAAEAARQVIRDRFDTLQSNIDAATSAEELELLVEVIHGEC